MKKTILICLIAAMLLSCTACGAAEPKATAAPTAAPTQPHVCASACESCGLCTDAACAEAVCAEKCTGVHWEEPHVFPAGDYITTEPVSIDTGTLVFDIGENVYVPGNLAEIGETIAVTIEKVTGLNFDGAGYARKYFPDGKIHVDVARDNMYAGNPNYPWYQGLQTSETGFGAAGVTDHVEMAPRELFFGDTYTLCHELGHMVMLRQSEWRYSQLLDEGFAEYTAYLVLQELEETKPEMSVYLDQPEHVIFNMSIWNYDKLFEQPLEYWFENVFGYSNNANYTIGFRFMTYLHEVYGDYSKWITEFEKAYNYNVNHGYSDESPVRWQVEVLKAAYGEDVLDNFYPWLKANLERFNMNAYEWDLSGVDEINWYPSFNAVDTTIRRERVQYEDLYINIESARNYLEEYKGVDAGELLLVTSAPVEVNLYHADGSYTTVMTNSEKTENPVEVYGWYMQARTGRIMKAKGVLSLNDISYIKLVGAGKLDWMEIVGDFRVLYDASA